MLSVLVYLGTGVAVPLHHQEFQCNLNFFKLHDLPAYVGISVIYILKMSCMLSFQNSWSLSEQYNQVYIYANISWTSFF